MSARFGSRLLANWAGMTGLSQDRPAAGDQSRSFRSTEVNVRFRRKPPINEADEALWILTGLALGRFHAMQLVIDGAIGAGWPPPRRRIEFLKC